MNIDTFCNAWQNYFAQNKQYPVSIDWEDDYQLSLPETDLIFTSIRQFQRGEKNEGVHLRKKAGYALYGDAYKPLHQLLETYIREQQNHSVLLERFMKQQRIPLMTHHVLDIAFRKIRRISSFDTEILSLLVALCIAQPYYDALKISSRSRVLQQVCRQILWNEKQHRYFLVSFLRLGFAKRTPTKVQRMLAAQKILLQGAMRLVWLHHYKVLTAGGYTYRSFRQTCMETYQEMWDFSLPQVKQEPHEWLFE
ncbi:MAG: hypothetical protein AAGI38_08805 [Bacteroidota bacterium]